MKSKHLYDFGVHTIKTLIEQPMLNKSLNAMSINNIK